MSVSEPAGQAFRIGAQDAATRMENGEPVTMLDARSQQAWSASPLRIRGAIRIDRDDVHIDPSWPKDRLTIVY